MSTCSQYVALLMCGLLLTVCDSVSLHAAEPGTISAAAEDQRIGINVPEGFRISLFADDDLAHNIYSMTIDSRGRVAVSGPGYVRLLIDSDGDGRAEEVRQYADGPASGAQGLYFDGADLICTGDAGLIRYRDRDGDDRADGPPELLHRFRTGSEHHVHAVRRGPDGWWYVLAGNNTGVTAAEATLPTSPIHRPQAGTLLRFTPDFSGSEIIADGYRNAYDFAFHESGDIFVYDSDGERDVSLPWYRPTRVFMALPATNAGWASRSWKRPDPFLDMPPVVGAFGRGSPTGVACYRHHAFPEPYRNAVFVLDWTFGRVIALPLKPEGSIWSSEPISFMTGKGQFGFAPTDIAVGPDGALYVSVGGRGTRGGVYRVTAVDASSHGDEPAGDSAESVPDETDGKWLKAALSAPQPLSSWSRAKWLADVRGVKPETLIAAALDSRLMATQRVRAIEILTELHGSPSGGDLAELVRCDDVAVRGRAIWSHGRRRSGAFDLEAVRVCLEDESPQVVRSALEVLCGVAASTDLSSLRSTLITLLDAPDRFVRQSVARALSRLPALTLAEFHGPARKRGPQAEVTLGLAQVLRSERVDLNAFEIGRRAFFASREPALRTEAIRLMQLALGDVGPGHKAAAVFDGYATSQDLRPHRGALESATRRLAEAWPTGDEQVDHELARLLAMLGPADGELVSRLLAANTAESHPVEDIHRLIVMARLPAIRTAEQREQIAAGLLALDAEIAERNLNQDNNWDVRIGELFRRLCELDADLPLQLVSDRSFGRAGHMVFVDELPEAARRKARGVLATAAADEDLEWTNELVLFLGSGKSEEVRDLIREQAEQFALRSAVLHVLARDPRPEDRRLFLSGLAEGALNLQLDCVAALEKLPADDAAAEQYLLLNAARRLTGDAREFALRERIIRLLRRNTGQEFGFVFGKDGHQRQADVFRRWEEWLGRRYPEEARRQLAATQAEAGMLAYQLSAVDWSAGDAARGEVLFRKRACAQCHGGRRGLGPDLAGVAGRFSRDDLFTAIAVPDRDVSPRYRTTLIQTTGGRVYSGVVIYESVDGLILRNGTNETFRIEAEEIEERRTLNSSLMPRGLLKDLSPGQLADLYAYLQRLGRRPG